ncbi:MAG: MAPEG family protein [Porticoccaceae bacterium]
MTIAFWTLLVAIAFPWLMAFIKKSSLATNGTYNNSAPRTQSKKLQGLNQRALWAEQNSFEILPSYIAAIIVAHMTGANQAYTDLLALLFIVSRALYALCYLMNWATLRSIVWIAGLACIVGLFVISS